MKASAYRFSSLVLLCLLLMGATGCIKFKQVITLMPDGSGKIEMRYGVSNKLAQLSNESGEDPFKEVNPSAMKDKSKGIVAFTKGQRSEVDGFTYLSYTAYFRDINQLRIDCLGEGKPATYRYRAVGEGADFSLSHGTTLSMIARHEPTPEPERDAVREAMGGLMLSEHFVLPGPIAPAKGLAVQGNTARLDLSLDNILQETGPIKSMQDIRTLTLRIEKVQADDAASLAFKQELEAAVKAWQAQQTP